MSQEQRAKSVILRGFILLGVHGAVRSKRRVTTRVSCQEDTPAADISDN
jgi:hypothetical protein